MAEAGENAGPAPAPVHYFCYSCNRQITSISPNFTCSTCGSGFIEEIQEGAEDPVSPPPLLFGGGGPRSVTISPGGIGQYFRSVSQPAGGQGQSQSISFDLFDILNSGLQQAQQEARQGQANSTGGTGSDPTTPNTSRPRGHFSLVIDSRPRHGGSRSDGGGGTSVTISGGPTQGTVGSGGQAQAPGPGANPVENMFSFLNDLISGLGGPGGNVNITGVPIGNLGDYVWGREGLDAIVTQLMNQMEGTGPPPMPEDKVKVIPDISISQEQVDHKLQCSVCWDDFKLHEKVKQLECEHLFHPDCIIPWLKLHGTCPICRRDFTDGSNPEHQDSTQASPDSTSPNAAGNSSSSNPTEGAFGTSTSNTSNPNPFAFLASLVNPGNPFSLIDNSTNTNTGAPPQTGGSSGPGQDNSRNPNGSGRDRNGGSGGGSRGTGAGGHLNLDNMEFDFD